MKTVRDLGEDALVKRLVAKSPLGPEVLAGPGDDCAVVRGPRAGEVLLLKADAVVEGVHFEGSSPPQWVGRKALARVLSDVAAMGGTPMQAMVTLVLPAETPVTWVDGVYSGLYALARRHGVSVVGGETTRGAQKILSVAMTGVVKSKSWVSRGGGREGDVILVTGRLGGSIRSKHFHFEPRLEQGRWLAEHFPIHAMMDLSDGLGKDLPRLAGAAGLGFQVEWSKLPRNRRCTIQQAWGDGEDYELLLAVSPRVVRKLMGQWAATYPKLPLTAIGRLVALEKQEAGLTGGWDAFTTSP
jgi:thiamine-monophosphate kinase